MKGSYKKFKNFSKLLYNINFCQTHYMRNSKTFDKKEVKQINKQKSSSNLIEPEIEYVSKLNFYSPETLQEKDLYKNIRMMHNSKIKSLERIFKKNNLYIEEQKFQTNEDKYANKLKENKLENERRDIEIKINKIKSIIEPLNERLTKIINEIESLKLDFDVLENKKTYSIIEKNLKKNVIEKELTDKPETNKNSINTLPMLKSQISKTEIIDHDKTKEQKLKIDTILLRHREEMKTKKNFTTIKIEKLNEQKMEIMKKLKACESDLKDFREERNKIKKKLLLHYHNLLLEGKDTRKEGLSWIIKAIWNLKSNVLLSYLPKFLDNESIIFLFSYSMKTISINSMYKFIQELSLKIKEKEESLSKKENKNSSNKGKIPIQKPKPKQLNILDYNASKLYTLNVEENKSESSRSNNIWLKEISKTNSFISHDKKINLFNRPKEILLDLSDRDYRNSILSKLKNTYNETFRTCLYKNTNIQEGKKEKKLIKDEKIRDKFEVLSETDENSFKYRLFNRKTLTEPQFNLYENKNKIKLSDFENLYKNKNQKIINKELLELYNTRKEVENNYLILKNEIENMVKNELERLSKCFYTEDYCSKYNIDQNSVISAIIGEEKSRNEMSKQKKEGEKYLNTLKELRRGKAKD